MSNRTIDRAVARKLYDGFSRAWRREKRLAGKYGEQGYRKPTFAQWYAMHQRDNELMAQSTPTDVQEYLGLDPWEPEPMILQGNAADDAAGDVKEERGVMTIQMVGEE